MSIGIGSIVRVYECLPYEPKNLSKELFVITELDNYEDAGSCSLSRDYHVIPLSELEGKDFFTKGDGIKIEARGTQLPFEEVTDVAPFKFEKRVIYKVERKVAKTITIYE